MSDPYGSFGNPYGAPPPYPNQPSAWPPPGPTQGPPPGPPPGPGLPPGAPLPPPTPYLPPGIPPLDRRPGVVTAGAVVAIVLSGLTLLLLLIACAGVIVAYVDPDPGDEVSGADFALTLLLVGFLIVLSGLAVVLAVLALARRQWARITLVVLGFVSFAAVLPLITSILLLLPPAGRWYAGRDQYGPPPLPTEVGLRQP